MAIFHLSVKTFSRSKGQSATASVAYRAGAKIECEREGRIHDYTKKGGVLHSEIFLPPNAPSWANDRQQLWNEAEKAEKRKNSTVAREFEVALPYELNEEQRIALVQDFAKQIVERHGCAVDAHLHNDDKHTTTKANHHAHIMLTTRKLEKDGFTSKTRELDQKQSGEVVYWREQWAGTVNKHLWEHGIEKQIDHRSLKEQGLEREPTIKMGVNASALERKGIKTNKGNYNRIITAYDPDKINKHLTIQFKQAQELHNKLKFIKRRLPEVKRDIADKQPKLYQAFDDMGIPTAPTERIIKDEQTREQVSTRMARQTSFSSSTDERERELPTANSSKSDQLGQAYTSGVRQTDNSIELTSSRDKIDDLKKELSVNEKRSLIESFNKHIDQEAEKLLNNYLKEIKDEAKSKLAEIERIKTGKPLLFGKKEWQQKLDSKVSKYSQIIAHHDEVKVQGVNKEIRTEALRNYYLERPEAYNIIKAMDTEVRAYDKEQSQREIDKQREQRISQLIEPNKDRGVDR